MSTTVHTSFLVWRVRFILCITLDARSPLLVLVEAEPVRDTVCCVGPEKTAQRPSGEGEKVQGQTQAYVKTSKLIPPAAKSSTQRITVDVNLYQMVSHALSRCMESAAGTY